MARRKSVKDLLRGLNPSDGPDDAEAEEAIEMSVQSFLAQIDHMRGQHRYGFADDTLRGIYDSVEERGFVADGQRRAVMNIRDSLGREPFE